jgi:hypothetical protein
MSNRHVLSLEVPVTANAQVLRVVDTSQYAALVDATCLRLEVLAPGYTTPAVITVTKEFNLSLNSVTLGLSSTPSDLPDGIYIIRYSVSPNDKVWVEYNHLRTTEIAASRMNELCKLSIGACEPPMDVKDKWKELSQIRDYIEAAKVYVEWCDKPKQGIALLLYAEKLLSRYKENHCTTC